MESAIIIAIIGLLGSIITICVTKRYEIISDNRRVKEQQYIEFLGTLARLKAFTGTNPQNYSMTKEELNSMLTSNIQTIYLVGNKHVQEAMKQYLDIFIEQTADKDKQSRLYANLIYHMKLDLSSGNFFKKKNSIEDISLGKITMTVFI